MSISKVYRVKKCRKAQGKCGACGDELPVGSSYLYWEPIFHSSYKCVRCMKPECAPRNSSLETSKVSAIYAAIEGVEDQLSSCTEADEFESLVKEVADAFEEVIQEYRDSMYGQDGVTVFNTVAEEKADELDSCLDELDGWTPAYDSPEPCEDHEDFNDECDECEASKGEWLDTCRDEVSTLLSGLSF